MPGVGSKDPLAQGFYRGPGHQQYRSKRRSRRLPPEIIEGLHNQTKGFE